MTEDDAIARFWAFWAESRPAIEAAIGDGTLSEWVEKIAEHVRAIDDAFDWEMGAGQSASHYFCISAKGDSSLRVEAEKWRARGPGDDATFEFHSSRPAGAYRPDATIEFEGVEFEQSDFQIAFDADETRERIHLEVHHPAFREAGEKLAVTATFITLDNVLGEDEVERWIGGVRLADAPIESAASLGQLAEAVGALRKIATGERFTVLRGELPDGGPVFVTANLALKRVDNLLMDMHVEMTFPLLDPTPEGLTTDAEAEKLNALEDVLCESLGRDAIYIARETYAGNRILHFHAAAEGPVLTRIDRFCREDADRDVDVKSALDPSWEILRRW